MTQLLRVLEVFDAPAALGRDHVVPVVDELPHGLEKDVSAL